MTQKKTIPVIGMACSACSANVEQRLRSLNGIISASVSLPSRTALVEWDDSLITLDDMKREISAIGYDLVIEADRSVAEMERREYTELRRKVVVSWVVALLVMAISMDGCESARAPWPTRPACCWPCSTWCIAAASSIYAPGGNCATARPAWTLWWH